MPNPRPITGLVAGIAAGLVASAAMAAFQAAVARMSDDDGGSDDDPATVKAADGVARAATGKPVPEPYRERSGQVVHYVTGAMLGGVYGVLAEYRPVTTGGFGSAYGLATSALLDEVAVPAAGLGDAPWKTPLSTHVYGVASHLVYGIALEATRTLIAGRPARS